MTLSVNHTDRYEDILTPDALDFLAKLVVTFQRRRDDLLSQREARRGTALGFLEETRDLRESGWTVAEVAADLQDRRVEITGPVDRKMVINALNSGATGFMADFEDSSSPTWSNMMEGQRNLRDAVARTITYEDKVKNKAYALNDKTSVLMVRPRGWHLPEAHIYWNGAPVSGALVDFGLYFFHNAKALLGLGSGPYFYLPKLEHHLEAQLWNDVFDHAQDELGIPRGSIRATVLIETLPAAFQMHEILHALRAHSAGLNCGRWDYIFSFIKNHQANPKAALPDREHITMVRPFMRAYTQLAIATCHQRGIHCMGGMSAFIPSKDAAQNETALKNVRADKQREAEDGHDGTWVAHPGLVQLARDAFDQHMSGPNQISKKLNVHLVEENLLAPPDGPRTWDGVIGNVRVGIRYLNAWLQGSGCVPIFGLMEDAATAEISRAQLWQWQKLRVALDDGTTVTADLIRETIATEAQTLREELEATRQLHRVDEAATLFAEMCTTNVLDDFLTLKAYALITEDHAKENAG